MLQWTIVVLLIDLFIFSPAHCAEMHSLCSSQTKSDVDCTQIAFPYSARNNLCNIKFFGSNSSDCSLLDIEDNETDDNFSLGSITIKPYFWDYRNQHNYNYTLFNVTFINIKWNAAKFRFNYVNENTTKFYKNHCRHITIDSSASDEIEVSPLSYDCHWSDQDLKYENATYTFEYQLIKGEESNFRRLLFKVPPSNSISAKNALPFCYIDITKIKKHEVELYIIPLSETDLIRSYSVKLCSGEDKNGDVNCDNEQIVEINNQEISLKYYLKSTGHYHFQVAPFNVAYGADNVPIITTSIFYIEIPRIIYTILWNVLIVILVIGFCFFMWKTIQKHRKFNPRILVIYPDADKTHTNIIGLVCKYLQIVHHWSITWNKEIESTSHGDPYIWCQEEFKNCNTIIYIERPSYNMTENSSENNPGNIHTHLREIFLKILKSSKRKDITYFNIMFDTHAPDKIFELKDFQTFYLPVQWNIFIHSIKRHSFIQRLFCKVPVLNESNLGLELLKAFDGLN